MKTLVYTLILIFSTALFFSIKQNISQSGKAVEQTTISIQTQIAKQNNSETNLIEKENRQMFDILEQADQVFAESWKILLQTKNTPQSVFKSIKNAIAHQLRSKSVDKTHLCFDTEIRKIPTVTGPSVYQVFKNDCRQKTKSILAQFRISASSDAEIMFYPQNLTESAGLALSVLNPKMYCRMNFDDTMQMKKLSCANLGQNFASDKHLIMTNVLYQNNQKEVLKLSAVSYENLQKEISKYNLVVPLSGKIKLAEKKYDPKIIYVDVPKEAETKVADDAAVTEKDPFNVIADNEKLPELATVNKNKKLEEGVESEVVEAQTAADSSNLLPGLDPNLNPNLNSKPQSKEQVSDLVAGGPVSEQQVNLEVKAAPATLEAAAQTEVEAPAVDEKGNSIDPSIALEQQELNDKAENQEDPNGQVANQMVQAGVDAEAYEQKTKVAEQQGHFENHPGQSKIIQKNLYKKSYIKQSAENIDVY